MTTVQTSAPATTGAARQWISIPLSAVTALAIWAFARAVGVAPVVGDRRVGAVAVVVTAAVAAAAGTALLLVLERRLRRGRAIWTALASAVLAVSLLGPLGARTASAAVALSGMHLAVYLVLVGLAHTGPDRRRS